MAESWIDIKPDSDFTAKNIPFGICEEGKNTFLASRIGDFVINVSALANYGYFDGFGIRKDVFDSEYLNPFISLGKSTCRAIRQKIIEIFTDPDTELASSEKLRDEILREVSLVKNRLPVRAGDYTDFYSSVEHATNVGKMFRDPDNALLPNWKYLPVGYHGRTSSIITSGTPIHRPKGQIKGAGDPSPVFGPSKLLDFELETAFITYDGKALGNPISTSEADDYIFGFCLFNDWSARDIQKWEYVPLGPFLGKNFASSISPWIIMLDALEPFRTEGPEQKPEVLPYLKYEGKKNFDINLEVCIETAAGIETTVCRSNAQYLYWNVNQQLAHQTSNGCNIRAGDIYGSGTISGPEHGSFGSMLELSWNGSKAVQLNDGSERTFINDGDTVIMRGYCEKDSLRLGFGEVRNKILPALD